MNYKMKEKL